jgi:uncharacterized protein (TIRG00374 family)
LLISLLLLGYFFWILVDKQGSAGAALSQLAAAFSQAFLTWLIPACLLHLVGYSLISFRWQVLLQAQNVHAPFGQLFLYYFMVTFFNTFLPSTIGGDVVRVLESRKLTGDTTTAAMVVIIERFSGMVALIIIVIVGLGIKMLTESGTVYLVWLFLGLVLTLFGLLVVGAHPRVARGLLRFLSRFLPRKVLRILERAYGAVEIYYNSPGSFWKALLISVLFQLNMVTYYYFIARALNQQPDPVEFLVKIPIMIFLLMTVPAINGLGVRTAGFKELMKFPEAYALAGEMIDLGLRIVYGLLGGAVFLFYRRPSASKK